MTMLEHQGALAKEAARSLAIAGTAKKNEALAAIADILSARQEEWLEANAADIAAAYHMQYFQMNYLFFEKFTKKQLLYLYNYYII